MGELAEMALQQELDEIDDMEYRRGYESWIRFRYANKTRWKTIDGTILDMKDMAIKHILNSIAMLERADHDYSDCPALHGLKEELARRNKMGMN